ncbi:MAG: hypothetical protein WAW96_05140 [Alphaproteobacteria bacterium]
MASTSTERDDMPEEPETYDATEVDENKWGALRMIGLLALIAAFAGFVYLAYMQGVRNGAVGAPPPVITAEGGPYKVAPQNPGGQSFANKDKMIFDRVEGSSPNEEKSASATPPASSASGDDMVSHKAAPLVVADSSPMAAKPMTVTPAPAPVVTASAPTALAPAPTQDHADGIAAAIEKADSQVPQSAATNDLTPKVTPPAATAKVEPVETPKPTLTAAPPAETKVATAETKVATAETKVATAEPPSAAAAAGAAGAYAVQIASYKDMPSAQDAWKKFSAKFTDVVGSQGPDYQSADVPGKGT